MSDREYFRNKVFERDGYKCVLCKEKAVDAHHIIERRLWEDGGYHIDNGASVCEKHHLLCESTDISVEEVRQACGIKKIVLPDHMYTDHIYDKWGNHILPNKQRTKGPLFYDGSVQKILKPLIDAGVFTDYVKYPRTFHVPWSNIYSDDKVSQWMDNLWNKHVIITEKMDGENTSLYRDHYHARSVDSKNHPTRNYVKAIHSKFAHDIPNGWRVCGENLFAKHSIKYTQLPAYFLCFSIWDDKNYCLSWDETLEWCSLFGIKTVPLLFDGILTQSVVDSISIDYNICEGYVIRLADRFHYGKFHKSVVKFVRPNHIQTTKHWMMGQKIERNDLE